MALNYVKLEMLIHIFSQQNTENEKRDGKLKNKIFLHVSFVDSQN